MMKATLLPLDGKYYGTRILIEADGGYIYEVNLWNGASYEPSDRELGRICAIEQWREDAPIPTDDYDWFPDGKAPARYMVNICDSHFESRETHALAQKIVRLLNDG